jgi:hypothetical protein
LDPLGRLCGVTMMAWLRTVCKENEGFVYQSAL